jgi:hypothetical protein
MTTIEADLASDSIIFGPPPLWDGEDAARYNHFRSQVLAGMKPGDIAERVLTYGFIVYQWELSRDRIVLANMIRANQYKGLCEVLTPLIGLLQAKTLSEGWFARKPDAMDQVNKVLTSAGLSMDTVMAQTFLVQLDAIERMNRMIEIKERRRNNCLHELHRHRETLGPSLRRAVQQLEEGQLANLESTSINGTKPQ